MIGSENPHHPLNQLGAKLTTGWPAFSRALGSMTVFALNSHWLLKVLSFHLIGRCDYFGFGLWHVIKKRSLCARQDALVKETTRWIYRGNDSLTVRLVAIS